MADKNYLEMSDDELLAAEVPVLDPNAAAEAPAQDQAAAAADDADDAAAGDQPAADADGAESGADPAVAAPAADAGEGDGEAAAADADGQQEEPKVEDKAPAQKAEKAEKPDVKAEKPDAKKEEPKKPEEVPAAIDYKAEYERLTAPFKANGRDIQVKSVDDAIALMQMGANYNKKMAGLKPNLKMLKMLENNGLLDEGKLSFLIDLDKKDPAAIQKLVKESGLDPMGFDAEGAGKYQPKVHAVDEREVDLDTVLDDIKDSTAYPKTIAIVSKEWDGASKQIIASTPQILKVINDHVERGIYDIIKAEVESERMFGRLAGLSDIEAYRKVGDAINARGGFNHLGSAQAASSQAGKIVEPKPKKADDEKLNEKRRAAAPTKPVAPTATPKDFNPLALSDEEFAKLAAPRFA